MVYKIRKGLFFVLPAIILFAATYVLMISFGKFRTWFALASGLLFAACCPQTRSSALWTSTSC